MQQNGTKSHSRSLRASQQLFIHIQDQLLFFFPPSFTVGLDLADSVSCQFAPSHLIMWHLPFATADSITAQTGGGAGGSGRRDGRREGGEEVERKKKAANTPQPPPTCTWRVAAVLRARHGRQEASIRRLSSSGIKFARQSLTLFARQLFAFL